MTIEKAVYTYLNADAPLTTLVSGRIHPLVAPQSTPAPYIIYQLISRGRQQTFCSVNAIVSSALQIDSYGVTYAKAKDIADAIESRLQNLRGTIDGVEVKQVFLDTELDLFDQEPGLYRVSQSYTIWHRY